MYLLIFTLISGLEVTSGSIQGFLMAVCSGITPGGSWGTRDFMGNLRSISSKEHALYIQYYLSSPNINETNKQASNKDVNLVQRHYV